jgi:hypothetical protein
MGVVEEDVAPGVRMLWDFVVVISVSCRAYGLVFSLMPWGYRGLVILVSCLRWYSAENLGLTSGLKCKCRRRGYSIPGVVTFLHCTAVILEGRQSLDSFVVVGN